MTRHRIAAALAVLSLSLSAACFAQSAPMVELDHTALPSSFPIAANGSAAAIYVAPQNSETVRVAAEAFASDVEKVTGVRPRILISLAAPLPGYLILVGVLGKSPEIDALVAAHLVFVNGVAGKWESAVTTVVASPMSGGVKSALVIAGSDPRGAAYALFSLSRELGVSAWNWWADVPVAHHSAVYVRAGMYVQPEPSVKYRGLFLNDEDSGMREWLAQWTGEQLAPADRPGFAGTDCGTAPALPLPAAPRAYPVPPQTK
jgi:hypothetical protein